MNIKEAPFIKAISNTGPMKLPSTSFWSGVLAVYASALFGAMFILFWTSLLGTGFAIELYSAALAGIFLALIFTALINLGIVVVAVFGIAAERKHRLQYVAGSIVGYISLLTILYFVDDPIYRWLEPMENVLAPQIFVPAR